MTFKSYFKIYNNNEFYHTLSKGSLNTFEENYSLQYLVNNNKYVSSIEL